MINSEQTNSTVTNSKVVNSIIFFGECMIELRQSEQGSPAQSFAGDVYNAAVYLKRTYPEIRVALSTAVGTDLLSNAMIDACQQEHVDTQLILRDQDKVPGLYWIHTDAQGERSFTYWRNDSAARYALAAFTHDYIESLKQANAFFFSGISLAIIEPTLREQFWRVINTLKEAGVTIIFDPNYRPRLWDSQHTTIQQYERAFSLSDIVLPGIEDFEQLYGLTTSEEVATLLHPYNITELVIKDGPNNVLVIHDSTRIQVPITPVNNVVDTTSAGDSFNGAYLGARMNNHSIEDAVQYAAHVAGTVIQYRGAIIPSDVVLSSS